MLIQEYSDLLDQNESTDIKNEEVYKNIKVTPCYFINS